MEVGVDGGMCRGDVEGGCGGGVEGGCGTEVWWKVWR